MHKPDSLARAIAFAEAVDLLPRCQHGACLQDGAGERLEPPCGCRIPRTLDRREDLLACPFCNDAGGAEYREEGKHLSPTMQGRGALVSYTIRHWCPRVPGCVSAYREVRGRDRAAAVAQWNRRSA